MLGFDDHLAVLPAIASATHILSSVPPGADGDPVLATYGDAIAAAPARWVGYLSSTGVYGDAGGGWVDEATPTAGRRGAAQRSRRGVAGAPPRVARVPPARHLRPRPLGARSRGGGHARTASTLPDQVFSRVHVDDIVGGVVASLDMARPAPTTSPTIGRAARTR